MGLDLISYHTDAVTGEDIDDYVDETEVQFFDGDGYTDKMCIRDSVSDDNWSLEKPFLWKSIYGDKTFTPINNSSLMTYSGYIAPPAADSFKIDVYKRQGGC